MPQYMIRAASRRMHSTLRQRHLPERICRRYAAQQVSASRRSRLCRAATGEQAYRRRYAEPAAAMLLLRAMMAMLNQAPEVRTASRLSPTRCHVKSCFRRHHVLIVALLRKAERRSAKPRASASQRRRRCSQPLAAFARPAIRLGASLRLAISVAAVIAAMPYFLALRSATRRQPAQAAASTPSIRPHAAEEPRE